MTDAQARVLHAMPPGQACTFGHIRRATDMSSQEVSAHLRALLDQKLIEHAAGGQYRRRRQRRLSCEPI